MYIRASPDKFSFFPLFELVGSGSFTIPIFRSSRQFRAVSKNVLARP